MGINGEKMEKFFFFWGGGGGFRLNSNMFNISFAMGMSSH